MSARPEESFDWTTPDYDAIFAARTERLMRLRADPQLLADVRAYYKNHPAQFIDDWAISVDPRNITRGLPAIIPFILFPQQRALVEWLIARWQANEPGLVEKSRDVGASWIAMALACTLCLFHRDMMIGVGSAKEDKLDRSGDPDTLLYKAKMFVTYLPKEFRGSWDQRKDAPYLRVLFPDTGSSITAEAGATIGRGGRKSLFILDESAHIERSHEVDAALAATTTCRIDMSSVHGMSNSFATRRHAGTIPVFTFHWRDDPRKNQAWYQKQCEILDPVTLAQEIDINYSASVEGIVIPSAWVSAAIDLHVRLGLTPTGIRLGALDVADRGMDKNAFCVRHGFLLEHAESWSGQGSDIFATTERAFLLADQHACAGFDYDGDGLGAGVRGDARKINERRRQQGLKPIPVNQFRGSGAVLYPDRIVPQTERRNEDFFANAKAQAWWALRFRFQAAYRASQGVAVNPDDLISIAAGFAERARLAIELSQPTYTLNNAGKILVDKAPENLASPNLADAVVYAFAPKRGPLHISDALLRATAR